MEGDINEPLRCARLTVVLEQSRRLDVVLFTKHVHSAFPEGIQFTRD